MKRFWRYLCAPGIFAAMSALLAGPAMGQFPDPKDTAKLYDAAKKEGTLVWYGSSAHEVMQSISKDFEAKYPGIKVEILRVVGVAQYQRFTRETEAKQYIADIVHISDYPSQKALVDQGHLAEWKTPAADRIPAQYRMGYSSYAPELTALTIMYNVNRVTPEEVKILESSWKGVLDPRFKGRFAVSTIKGGATYLGVHMFLDPKNEKIFGRDFVKAVAAQLPAAYPSTMIVLDRVVVGEQDFSYWTFDSINYIKWLEGAPIRWVSPTPTPVAALSWYGISKYAPHPNAARLFLNWYTSEEGAAAINRVGLSTTLEGVKDLRKVVNEPWHKPVTVKYEVDWTRWQKDFHKDMDFWIESMTRK